MPSRGEDREAGVQRSHEATTVNAEQEEWPSAERLSKSAASSGGLREGMEQVKRLKLIHHTPGIHSHLSFPRPEERGSAMGATKNIECIHASPLEATGSAFQLLREVFLRCGEATPDLPKHQKTS